MWVLTSTVVKRFAEGTDPLGLLGPSMATENSSFLIGALTIIRSRTRSPATKQLGDWDIKREMNRNHLSVNFAIYELPHAVASVVRKTYYGKGLQNLHHRNTRTRTPQNKLLIEFRLSK